MDNRNTKRRLPFSQTEKFDYFDAKLYEKADRELSHVYNGTLSSDERIALTRAIRELYFDRDNYPRTFNLRIARRFDTEQLDVYYESAKNGYRKFFDTTITSRDGSFYFGFNHN